MKPSDEPGPLVRASDRAWRILIVLALLAVIVIAGVVLSAVAVPVLLAVVVVPVGRPLFKLLDRKLPGALAAALVLLVAVTILTGAGWLMTASIIANWNAMWAGITDAAAVIADWIGDTVTGLTDEQVVTIEDNLEDLAGTVASVLFGGVTRSVVVLGTFFVGLFLFLVTLYFGLRDWDEFRAWVIGNTGPHIGPKVDIFFDRYSFVLRNYWRGQALLGLFDAVAIGLGLWAIGVPLALPIAVLTFVLSFIPYIGAIVSSVLAVFVALGTGSSGDALLALLLSLLVFNTGENLMRPWLIGETLKMPTYVAFIASTIGILVAGALGAILAIPIVALAGEARRVFFTE
ncbi:MAG: AI-2E family transporter [Actinomycetota bacterium]|nr:AI-2E family transporter [Actinomycetota bacterium]